MQCPVCPDTTLAMANRENIEIDYCPKCRGVWLDRGELDKIIERTAQQMPPSVQQAPSAPYRGHDPRHGRKRKEGLLGELFDFD